jgi:hypothetical protein
MPSKEMHQVQQLLGSTLHLPCDCGDEGCRKIGWTKPEIIDSQGGHHE